MQNIDMLRFGMQNIEILMSRKLSLLPFLIRSLFFSQGILDYLDNLTVTQIRKLFSMLSTLAFANQQDGGLIQVICNKNGARALMYCRQDKARQCFIWSLTQSYVHRLGVDGGGWGRWGEYSPKFYTGRLFTEVVVIFFLGWYAYRDQETAFKQLCQVSDHTVNNALNCPCLRCKDSELWDWYSLLLLLRARRP